MSERVMDLYCHGCGAPVGVSTGICKYCGGEISIATFNSVRDMSIQAVNNYKHNYEKDLSGNPGDMGANKAIAYCYLKLGMRDEALHYFEKAVTDNFDDSEVYFYAAICLLKGKKAYQALRPQINKIEEYLKAATMIEPKGIYYYFWAYIKYDYYKRKFLNTTPDYAAMLKTAASAGVSVYDKAQLFEILGVEKPSVM